MQIVLAHCSLSHSCQAQDTLRRQASRDLSMLSPHSNDLIGVGAHIHHQARHCESQRRDRSAAAALARATGRVQRSPLAAARGAQQQRRRHAPGPARLGLARVQGRARDSDAEHEGVANTDGAVRRRRRGRQHVQRASERYVEPPRRERPADARLAVLRSRKSLNADSPLYAAAPTDRLGADVKGKGRATNSDFLMLDMAGGGAATQGGAQSDGGFMQLQQMEEQDNSYLQSRSTAIESIESTIAELGQVRRGGSSTMLTRSDLWPARAYGPSAGRDRAEDRHGHLGYRTVRSRGVRSS